MSYKYTRKSEKCWGKKRPILSVFYHMMIGYFNCSMAAKQQHMKRILVSLSLCCLTHLSAGMTFNVVDYGAVGDNVTDDTAAFVAAIADISEQRNNNDDDDLVSVLLVPTGGKFLIQPINLTSNMVFLIQNGATVLGKMNQSEWPIIPGAPSYGQVFFLVFFLCFLRIYLVLFICILQQV
jgi:hypothetical protein